MNEAAKNEFPVCDMPDVTPEVLYAQAEAKLPHMRFYAPNDMGNAQRFLDECGEAVRYCTTEQRWYVFNGQRWLPDTTMQAERLARTALETSYDKSIAQCQSDQTDPLQNGIQKLLRQRNAAGNVKSLRNCLSMAAVDAAMDVTQFDADPYKIHFNNGSLNLRNKDLFEGYTFHRASEYFSKMTNAGIDFDQKPNEDGDIYPDCPHWIQFVSLCCMGDKEMYQYLQRAVSYSVLTGDISEQKVFCLLGEGRNGKSLFINTIAAIAGDYACKLESSVLCRNRFGEKDNDVSKELYRIRGSRFVYSNEFSRNSILNESFLKAITDGGKISCRPLYGSCIEYTPTYTLWFSTNHLPNLQAMDEGIRRRIVVIPFRLHIPEDMVDRNLGNTFLEEANGIFLWLLAGYYDYLEYGLTPPEAVRQATAQYFAEQDIFQQFLEECYLPIGKNDGMLYAKEVYADYVNWCATSGEKPVSKVLLSRELKRLHVQKKENKKGTYYFLNRKVQP